MPTIEICVKAENGTHPVTFHDDDVFMLHYLSGAHNVLFLDGKISSVMSKVTWSAAPMRYMGAFEPMKINLIRAQSR